MKKLITGILALAMAFALVSCGEDNNNKDKGENNTPETKTESSAEEIEEAEKKKQEEEEKKKLEEEEKKKQEEEEAAKKKQEEEEAAKKKQEEEEAAKKKQEEEEAAKKKQEEEAKAKKEREEFLAGNHYYYGYFVRADSAGDLREYSVCVAYKGKGGTFWNSNDQQITVSDTCIEVYFMNGGTLLAPQDTSKSSATVQRAAEYYLRDFDADMMGLSSTPSSWADCFSSTYFTALGGITYNKVKYIPVGAGGYGGGSPLFKVTVKDDGTFTIGKNLTGIELDYKINSLKMSSDTKTMTAKVTLDGKSETVTLNCRY